MSALDNPGRIEPTFNRPDETGSGADYPEIPLPPARDLRADPSERLTSPDATPAAPEAPRLRHPEDKKLPSAATWSGRAMSAIRDWQGRANARAELLLPTALARFSGEQAIVAKSNLEGAKGSLQRAQLKRMENDANIMSLQAESRFADHNAFQRIFHNLKLRGAVRSRNYWMSQEAKWKIKASDADHRHLNATNALSAREAAREAVAKKYLDRFDSRAEPLHARHEELNGRLDTLTNRVSTLATKRESFLKTKNQLMELAKTQGMTPEIEEAFGKVAENLVAIEFRLKDSQRRLDNGMKHRDRIAKALTSVNRGRHHISHLWVGEKTEKHGEVADVTFNRPEGTPREGPIVPGRARNPEAPRRPTPEGGATPDADPVNRAFDSFESPSKSIRGHIEFWNKENPDAAFTPEELAGMMFASFPDDVGFDPGQEAQYLDQVISFDQFELGMKELYFSNNQFRTKMDGAMFPFVTISQWLDHHKLVDKIDAITS